MEYVELFSDIVHGQYLNITLYKVTNILCTHIDTHTHSYILIKVKNWSQLKCTKMGIVN